MKGTPEDSADLVSEDLELVAGTIARLFVFGGHWREGLDREPHGRAKHNAWRDACYGTLDPSSAQMVAVPPVLVILEDLSRDVGAPPRGFDAMTPAALAAAITKLPPHWMIWEGFVLTYYDIQDNVLAGKMTPFADQLQYPA